MRQVTAYLKEYQYVIDYRVMMENTKETSMVYKYTRILQWIIELSQ